MSGYSFKIISRNDIDWAIVESCYDHTVFKTREWINFLIVTQDVEPFVLEIHENDRLIGFFVGEKFTRFINIIASPFEGWTTDYQGLSLLVPVTAAARMQLYKALISFLFKKGLCTVFQASDWQLDMLNIQNSGLDYEIIKGYKLDLRPSEEQIYKNFSSSSCQYAIRKSQKNGVTITQANDVEQFVHHYCSQLEEVFEKQGLKPTYTRKRVSALIDQLKNSNHLLLLEARSSQGDCLATGIFAGDNKMAYFWGGASYTRYQNLCPNEPIIFEAIKYWKGKGYEEFDMGGIRKYKEKFGPVYYEKPRIIASRYKGLLQVKNLAKKSYYSLREFGANVRKVITK